MVSRIRQAETESSKIRHLDILSARCSIDKSWLDFMLDSNSFCASNASFVLWKDRLLPSFVHDASNSMASMMADKMDKRFPSLKYDVQWFEVQNCLYFTPTRHFAANIITFILFISDFVWNLRCEITTIYRVFINNKSNFIIYSNSYFRVWYKMIKYPRKYSPQNFN